MTQRVLACERAPTLVVLHGQHYILHVVHALPIVRQRVVVFQIERGGPGCALPLAGEPRQHALLERHRGVVFAEPSVDETADASTLLHLVQQDLFALRIVSTHTGTATWGASTCCIPACLLWAGRPVTPLTLRPPTGCLSRVTLTSNGFSWCCIARSLAACFTLACSESGVAFFFLPLGLERADVSWESWDPLGIMGCARCAKGESRLSRTTPPLTPRP